MNLLVRSRLSRERKVGASSSEASVLHAESLPSQGAACNYRPHDLNDKGLLFHPFLPALTLFCFNGTSITINISRHTVSIFRTYPKKFLIACAVDT